MEIGSRTVVDGIMKPLIRFILGVAALFPASAVLADEGTLRVDVVVDVTEAGKGVSPPSQGHPVFYYPWTSGYHQDGAILEGEGPPPPTASVQHLVAKALAEQGYFLYTKKSPPSLLLVLWWGYMAPIIDHPFGESTGGTSPSTIPIVGVGLGMGTRSTGGSSGLISAAGGGLSLPAGVFEAFPNQHEMLMLVGGSKHDVNRLDPQREDIQEAARNPRYYLIVSALDFQAALHKKPVLLWCARVSTERAGHHLDEVLPTLIAAAGPSFGQETTRPRFAQAPLVPAGRVEVGTPEEKP
jgi:hypothetical protein